MSSEMDEMCERYGIEMTWAEGPTHERDTDGWEHHAGMVLLTHHHGTLETQRLVTPYKMGMGIDPTGITAADVVSSVASDARFGREGFEDLCSELGYDTDSRKAYATWEQCRAMVARFDDFCTGQQMLDDLGSAEH